ncbi:M23 family metallopeptidase [Pseudomonas sp. PDM17]|uniref:M23 family metallopeptidase n=1 Tax=Pseudomonas sp. PDM17 TaxID=2769285 RepID=UPI00177DC8A0|nr:M23 family metallopeptidase [Pseudomonas sp. PDM17]MBD9503195.1 M23 family metallopeptidase [Pseudomonas sp. PDM17]
MIISPPFIPAPVAGETDEAFVERAMPGGNLGDGAYPLSFDLNWHGGLHLRAPQENGKNLPVRAIADGTLAFFRAPEKKTDDPNNALNYGNGWTDNGCIVLRHETEIGEGARSQVVFYSIYMHLSKINIANPQLKQRVYRKDSIGEVGEIYGSAGKIHFEIIASDTQVEHLTGRSTRELDYRTRDGRTDSCWGDMYFYVPSTLQGFAAPPSNFASPTITGAASFSFPALPAGWLTPSGSPSGLAITTTQIDGYRPEMVKQMQQGLIVRMRYDKGQCQLTTYHLTGELIGSQSEEADFEYNLYTTATRRYPACPSAGYELLRFGRVLGPDALQPADAAHWRKISLPPRTEASEAERSAWFNLNAPGVTRFSDADFPHWMGWRLIDDDDDSDSHCQSDYIRTLLEPSSHYTDPPPRQPDAASIAISPAYDTMTAGDQRRLSEQYVLDRERNEARLADAGTHEKLKRLICKFPTEWARDDFDTRYGWLKKVAAGGPMSEDDFEELEKHQKALAFWEDAGLADIDNKHWHFPPKEFAITFKRCGWLSLNELTQLIPKYIIRKPGSNNSQSQGVWEQPNITASITFIKTHSLEINRSLQKFLINTPSRQACFFGNSTQETSWFRYLKESNGSNPTLHSGWYGRGLLQLTNPNGNLGSGNNNYYRYFRFSGKSPSIPPTPSELIWRNEIGELSRQACDSAGAYWVWPDKSGPTINNPSLPQVGNTNRFADVAAQNKRRQIQTNSGLKTWYYNQSFTNTATAVNYPAATGSASPNMNGLVDRSTAYTNAIIVLSDTPRFEAPNGSYIDTPEDFQRRVLP